MTPRSDEPLADVPRTPPVLGSERLFAGRIWDVVAEEVDLGHTTVRREFVDHPGAVAVVALDDDDRVLLLRQYRHPVRAELWEPPAGLCDVEGEALVDTAARELAEEADLVAGTWAHLLTFRTTPGGSSEKITIFLARDLRPVADGDRFERTDEEADMVPVWVPLDDAVSAVLDGRLQSPTAVAGVLAAAAGRARGWSHLAPVSPGTPIG